MEGVGRSQWILVPSETALGRLLVKQACSRSRPCFAPVDSKRLGETLKANDGGGRVGSRRQGECAVRLFSLQCTAVQYYILFYSTTNYAAAALRALPIQQRFSWRPPAQPVPCPARPCLCLFRLPPRRPRPRSCTPPSPPTLAMNIQLLASGPGDREGDTVARAAAAARGGEFTWASVQAVCALHRLLVWPASTRLPGGRAALVDVSCPFRRWAGRGKGARKGEGKRRQTRCHMPPSARLRSLGWLAMPCVSLCQKSLDIPFDGNWRVWHRWYASNGWYSLPSNPL